MSLSFQDYLDGKFDLDERSLNAEVRAPFRAEFARLPRARVLDLGAGTGANLRRLLAAPRPGQLEIAAVDLDAASLDLGRLRMEAELRERGFALEPAPEGFAARRGDEFVGIRYIAADFQAPGLDAPEAYDIVLAHAVLDLLPAVPMAQRIARWLRPGGLAYASLNYDGGTSLFPAYPDMALEQRILAVYNESMERRRCGGQPTAGARSGRRLHAAFLDAGLDLLAYGSSDWNLTPRGGAYRGREAAVLAYLLGLIRGEAERSGEFEPAALAAWQRDRAAELERSRLGLICHQIDLLAVKP